MNAFEKKFGPDGEVIDGGDGIDIVKLMIGGFAIVGVIAIGSFFFNLGGSSADQAAFTTVQQAPAVPMYIQAQQAALQAMQAQQQAMQEMRMRMAEADGYYEEDYGRGNDDW